MDALALVQALINRITQGDVEGLRSICDKLTLNQVSVESSDGLLALLLDIAAYENQVECAKVLYQTWQQTNLEEERFSLVAYMMARPLFSDRAILIAMQANDDAMFSSLFDEITSRDDSPETLAALTRLLKLLGIPEYEDLVKLRQIIIEMELKEDLPFPRMKGFINSFIEESAPFAEKPKYMIPGEYNADELESIVADIRTKPSDISLKEKVNLLTAGLKLQGVSLDQIEESKLKLQEQLESMSDGDQKTLLAPVLEDLNFKSMTENPELFKIFGPNHPVYGMDLDDSDKADPCQRFGGCRMFLCVCSETLHDEEELGKNLDIISDPEETEWFHGVCDFCHKKIEKKCYAVRRPGTSGSFIGEFCKWQCVRDDTPENDIMTHSLIDLMEDQVNKTGIYDRIYPSPIEEPEE